METVFPCSGLTEHKTEALSPSIITKLEPTSCPSWEREARSSSQIMMRMSCIDHHPIRPLCALTDVWPVVGPVVGVRSNMSVAGKEAGEFHNKYTVTSWPGLALILTLAMPASQ